MMTMQISCRVVLVAATLLTTSGFVAYSYDLFGNDVGGIDVQNPDQCSAACNSNPNCLAWTFVRAGIKGPSARCFFKNPVPAPSFNNDCKTHADCVSGPKPSGGAGQWCGESPARAVSGNPSILGQDVVLSCPAGRTCGPRVTRSCTGWWIFRTCDNIQSVDFFCL